MKHRTIVSCVIGLLCLALPGAIAAQAPYTPQEYYNTADAYYVSEDYLEALRFAWLARDAFEEADDQAGVQTADSLIDAIESQYSPLRLADAYYAIAGDHYLTGQYVDCMDRAQRALAIYQELERTSDAYKAQDLIDSANDAINKLRGDLKEQADLAYRMAKDYYLNEDYFLAREYAKNASALYAKVPYQTGRDNADELIASAQARIVELRNNAGVLYDNANDLFVAGDLERAKVPAAKSLEIYKRLRDAQGIDKAERLMRRIALEEGQTINERLQKADLFRQDAEDYFIRGDCQNATYWVVEARDIYMDLYRDASLVSDKRERERLHEFYQGFITACNQLLNQIQEECGREVIKAQADDAYLEAQKQLLLTKYRLATTYAQKARSMCSQIDDFVCVAKVEDLITEINRRVEEKQRADALFEDARGFYERAEFQNALLKAEESKAIYEEIWHKNLSSEVDAFKEEVYAGMAVREDADAIYDQAQQAYEAGDYQRTVELAARARERYQEINMSIGIQGATTLIEESRAVLDARERERRNQQLLIGGIVVVGFVVIGFIYKKRKDIEEEAFEREQEERRVKMQEEDEWEIKKQEETEQRVKEELEAILRRERSELEKEQ